MNKLAWKFNVFSEINIKCVPSRNLFPTAPILISSFQISEGKIVSLVCVSLAAYHHY